MYILMLYNFYIFRLFSTNKKRMCQSTFSCRARSLATIYSFARVRISGTLVPFLIFYRKSTTIGMVMMEKSVVIKTPLLHMSSSSVFPPYSRTIMAMILPDGMASMRIKMAKSMVSLLSGRSRMAQRIGMTRSLIALKM